MAYICNGNNQHSINYRLGLPLIETARTRDQLYAGLAVMIVAKLH